MPIQSGESNRLWAHDHEASRQQQAVDIALQKLENIRASHGKFKCAGIGLATCATCMEEHGSSTYGRDAQLTLIKYDTIKGPPF